MLSRALKEFWRPPGEGRPTGCASTILLVTSVYLSLGIVALGLWGATGEIAWVVSFFRIPGAMLLVWLSAIELWLALRVREHFQPGEALHAAWIWISLAALCHLVGGTCAQVLGKPGGINPLALLPVFNAEAADHILRFGKIVAGPIRYGLLAFGLFGALKAHKQAGFQGRLLFRDWALLVGASAFVIWEVVGVTTAIRHGRHFSLFEVAGWPLDPILVLLFAEALMLHRSVAGMGAGWVSRCWRSYSIAVFLILVGEFGLWVTSYDYLHWPWSAVVWYIWLPANCAFALAPAYQLETIFQAVTEGRRNPEIQSST